jgi:hypothetical protein
MTWGTFKTWDAVHVCPCDINGWPLAPHLLATDCGCRPTITQYDGEKMLYQRGSVPLVTHHDFH